MTLDLNYEVLLDTFESKMKSDRGELVKIEEEISRNNHRLQNAQHLMLDAEISASDYKEIKVKISAANDELIRKKANVSSSQEDFREHLRVGATVLRNIDGFYQNATLSEKQLIIGSVFPEKLIFEKNQFRTNRVNEAIILMSMEHNDLDQKKSGRAKKFLAASTQVEVRRFELPTPTSLTWCANRAALHLEFDSAFF